MKKIPWVERQFDFNFPQGIFPCILERLRGTPARLEEMVRSVPSNILTTRINNGWSIQEYVGHLLDLDELHEGRIDDFQSHATVLRLADIMNKKTWDANHNSRSMQNLLSAFRVGRMHFVKRLEDFDEATIAVSSLHPRLQKPMRLIDFAYFVVEHDDHHLASITELSRILRSKA